MWLDNDDRKEYFSPKYDDLEKLARDSIKTNATFNKREWVLIWLINAIIAAWYYYTSFEPFDMTIGNILLNFIGYAGTCLGATILVTAACFVLKIVSDWIIDKFYFTEIVESKDENGNITEVKAYCKPIKNNKWVTVGIIAIILVVCFSAVSVVAPAHYTKIQEREAEERQEIYDEAQGEYTSGVPTIKDISDIVYNTLVEDGKYSNDEAADITNYIVDYLDEAYRTE